MLENEGWTVARPRTAALPWSSCGRERPDLILLDLMMPEMDGFEFAAEVRKRPEWRSIPIVVLDRQDLSARRGRLRYVEKILLQKKAIRCKVIASATNAQ